MIEVNDWFSLWFLQLVQTSVLVLVVLVIVRLFAKNRPHLSHALWAIVVLKCLTPPVIALPTSPFSWMNWSDPQQVTAAGHSRTREAAALSVESFTDMHSSLIQETSPTPELGRATEADPLTMFSYLAQTAPISIGWRLIVLTVWLGGVFVAASWLTIRLWRLLRRIRQCSLDEYVTQSSDLKQLLEVLGQELKLPRRLRSRVRVRVIDTNVGPAVIGLVRPTVLIPACIVTSTTSQQLKLLLAHELIHLKRRDLNWAGLQTVASIIWWFNPLILFCSRMLSLEAERSCDEETLANLKCDPAAYARCLIQILQMKNRLDVLPALPGIRPVEVTAKRMERIMRLGNQGFSNRPWWVLPLSVLFALVALPGAQWLSGQTNDPNKSTAVGQPTASVLLPKVIASDDKQAQQSSERKERQYSVGKSIQKIQDNGTAMRELAMEELKDRMQSVIYRTEMKNATLVELEVIDSETIKALLTDQEHEKVQAELTRIEVYGLKQLVIETRMITIPAEDLKQIVLDWTSDSAQTDHDHERESPNEAASAVGKSFRPPFLVAEINSDQLAKVTNQLQSNRNVNILSAPRISLFNGMRAQITDATLRPFVTGLNKKAENSQGQPVVSVVPEGLSFECRPEILIDSRVTLNVQVGLSQIRRVNELTFRTNNQAENEGVTLQVPDVNSVHFQCGTQPIKLGNTLMVATRNLDTSKNQVLILAITASQKTEPLAWIELKGEPPVQVQRTKDQLTILGPTLKQGQTDNSFPSDDDLVQALDKSVAHKEILSTIQVQKSKLKISWRQVSQSVEPTRFIPTIGYAQNVLTKFEATITGDDGQSLGRPILISRSQFRMMDSASQQVRN